MHQVHTVYHGYFFYAFLFDQLLSKLSKPLQSFLLLVGFIATVQLFIVTETPQSHDLGSFLLIRLIFVFRVL